MASTTFNGPVRSEKGFQVATKNTSTGAVTTRMSSGMPDLTGLSVSDVATASTLTLAADTISVIDYTGAAACAATLPAATAGRHIRFVWTVEQATSDRVFTRAGSDTIVGNITTKVQGNAGGDGDVVAVATSTAAITVIDDVNIGSYLDFHCAVDAKWIVTGELIVDAVGSVPTLA